MTVKEISPERFLYELYDAEGQWGLDDALHVATEFGYCDASRLLVRPKSGEFALMVTWPDGASHWFHIMPTQLELIRRRLARRSK